MRILTILLVLLTVATETTWAQCPAGLTPSAGQISFNTALITNYATKQTTQLPANHIALCFGDQYGITNNQIGTLPPAAPSTCAPPNTSTHGFVIYNANGSGINNPNALNSFSTNTIKQPTITPSNYPSYNNPPAPFGVPNVMNTTNQTHRTMVFRAFTFDFLNPQYPCVNPSTATDGNDPDGNNDGCYAFGSLNNLLYVTYLNPITVTPTITPSTCAYPGKVIVKLTIKGGFPEFFDNHNVNYGPAVGTISLGDIASYTLTNNTGIGILSSNTVDDHNGFVNVDNVAPGQTIEITITDNNGCPFTFQYLVPANATASPNPNINPIPDICKNSPSTQLTPVVTGGSWSTLPVGGAYLNASGVFNPTNATCGTNNVVYTLSGCSDTLAVTVKCPRIDSIVGINPSCFGSSNGSIKIYSNDGIPNKTYTISGGSFSNPATDNFTPPFVNLVGLTAGTYTIKLTAPGCGDITQTFTLTEPSILNATNTITNIKCVGETGTIPVSASGGTAPYTYQWAMAGNPSFSNTTSTASNLSPGTYSVTVTDSKSCTKTITGMVIDQPAQALAISSFTDPQISCFGDLASQLCPTVVGGQAPYAFTWTGATSSTDSCLSNIGGGTYNLAVTDQRGCVVNASKTITAPTAALTVTAAPRNISCFGLTDGRATVTITGGAAPYAFSWIGVAPPSNDDSILTNLNSGTYVVEITDVRGCKDTVDVVVTAPDEIETTPASQPISCKGFSDGLVGVSTSGGTPPFSYSWEGFPGNNANYLENIPAGTYNVTITDSEGCSKTESITIQNPDTFFINPVTSTTTCIDGNDGIATVETTWGAVTDGFTYNWGPNYPGINNDSLTNLSPGTYQVIASNLLGCKDTAEVDVVNPASIIIQMLSDSVKCFGESTGIGTVVLGLGEPPFAFSWSNSNGTVQQDVDSILQNITAGWYYLTVTDNVNCDFKDSIEVKEPSKLKLDSLHIMPSQCPLNNGSISAIASGGTTLTGTPNDYTFSWINAGMSAYNGNPLQNIPASVYNLTITDKNGCTLDSAITVDEIVVLNIHSQLDVDSVLCNGGNTGRITFNPSNGNSPFTYVWSAGASTGNSNIAENLAAGTYLVTISDLDGCTKDTSIVVLEPLALTATITILNQVSCFDTCDAAASAVISGGTSPYLIDWNTGTYNSTMNSNSLCAGAQDIKIKDANLCPLIKPITITQPSKLEFDAILGADPSCHNYTDGSIIVSMTGGTPNYSYAWSHNPNFVNANPSNLAADTFSVTVTDQNGCVLDSGVRLTNPNPIHIFATVYQDTCDKKHGKIILNNITGNVPFPAGYTFAWSAPVSPGNSQNALNLDGNLSYSVTVTDNFNCSKDTSMFVVELSGPRVQSISTTPTTCFGGNDGTAQALGAGGNIISIANPYNYAWSNGGNTAQISNLTSGIYTVTVIDAFDCEADSSITITSPTEVQANPAMTSDSVCANSPEFSTIVSTPTGGTGTTYTYLWSNGATTNSINVNLINYGDEFSVVATDQNNCASQPAIVTPNLFPPTQTTLVNDTQICRGSTLSLTVQSSGGNSNFPVEYLWSDGSFNQSASFTPETYPNPTSYSVNVNRGCGYYLETVHVSFFTNPIIGLSADNTLGCPPLNVTFQNNTPNTTDCLWDFGNGQVSNSGCTPYVTYTSEGCHDVRLTTTTTDGCLVDTLVTCMIETYYKPTADFRFSPDSSTVIDPEIEFFDLSIPNGTATEISSITWAFNATDSIYEENNPIYIFPTDVGLYPVSLMVIDNNGCTDTTTKLVRVLDVFKVYVPNAFTPGRVCDGINDKFCPSIIGLGNYYELKIFNRWGEKVFESFDYETCWNGQLDGLFGSGPAQSGIYLWELTVRDNVNKQLHQFFGKVYLMRN